jgi:hypothetical protein
MLLGLALAPLTDQQQGGAVDAEEEQQTLQPLQQAPLTPDAKAPPPSSSPLSVTNDNSVDAAAKKVARLPQPPPSRPLTFAAGCRSDSEKQNSC